MPSTAPVSSRLADGCHVFFDRGEQVFTGELGEGRGESVAAPVGDAGEDEFGDFGYAGFLDEGFDCRNFVGDVAQADFVAAVADADCAVGGA